MFKFISTNIVLSKIHSVFVLYFNVFALHSILNCLSLRVSSLSLDFVTDEGILEKFGSHSHTLVNFLFHGVGFLLNAGNELKNEVNNFFFLEFVEVLLTDHETEVEILSDGLAAEDLELVGTLLEESRELSGDEVSHGVTLVHADRYSSGVDTTFN